MELIEFEFATIPVELRFKAIKRSTKKYSVELAMDKLVVGESFLIPPDVYKAASVRSRVFYIARKYNDGRKFSTHVTDGGVRVRRNS